MCVCFSPVVLASIHNLLVAAQDRTARYDPDRLHLGGEIVTPAAYAIRRPKTPGSA